MSEDDRAAKAARARAMLKKRQQQKVVGSPVAAGSPSIASPNLPPSRTYSPAPSEVSLSHVEAEKGARNTGDLFASGSAEKEADASWLSSLTRVDSTPHVAAPSPLSAVQSPTLVSSTRSIASPPPPKASPGEREDLRAQNRDQQRTISQLESDKARLLASVEELRTFQSEARQFRELAELESAKFEKLQKEKADTEAHVNELTSRTRELQATLESFKSENMAMAQKLQRLDMIDSNLRETDAALQNERSTSHALQGRIQELQGISQGYSEQIEQQQSTISLLVSEKTSLTSSLERLENAESRLQETESLLQLESAKAERLQASVKQLEATEHASSDEVARLSATEKQLTDKCRDQEREIQLLTSASNELRAQADQHSRRAQELEEQIQSDDRAERLEATLQNTQDRADELEFQLSKLHQSHSTLRLEKDDLEAQVRQRADAEAEWRSRHADVEKLHAATRDELSALSGERAALLQHQTSLQSQIDDRQNAIAELQQKLVQVAAELSSNARQLQQAQAELRGANRRAEEAERLQKEVQAEGVGLMRSLDEMRPKIIELTDVKLELGERVEGLENALRSRDAAIAQLEATLDEVRNDKEEGDRERQELQAALERDRMSSSSSASELQKAYVQLQTDLEQTRASVRTLESERTHYYQLAERHAADSNRLTSEVDTLTSQADELRGELDESQQAQDEAQDFLERAQTEMEALRADLTTRDELIERLQEAAPASPGAQSLDGEMLSALRQQHALELSAAQSQIRTLEAAVFAAEAHAHALQRRAAALEDQLRAPSRNVDRSDDLRRASLGSRRPPPPAPPSALSSAFDGLSPEARHKRRVSLGMLKARIDSEVAAAGAPSRPPSSLAAAAPSPLSTVHEPRAGTPHSQRSHGGALRKPQFLDAAHVFWCHACQGDLVIL